MGAFRYFISAQAYELISAPRAISTIFGVFQVINSSLISLFRTVMRRQFTGYLRRLTSLSCDQHTLSTRQGASIPG
jgi:hypothetical protein